MELSSSWALGSTQGSPSGTAGSAALRHLPPVATRTSTRSPLQLGCSSRHHMRRRTSFSKRRLPVTCCTPSVGGGEGDRRQPPEATPKAGGEFKRGHADPKGVGAHLPWVACSFVPLLGDTTMKKRALEMLSSWKGHLGDKVELVIKPTKNEGTDVGINCHWDWKKTKNLRKGCSFYTSHTYQGKAFINNVEAITESIIHNAVLKLILMGCLGPLLHQRLAAKVVHGESRARLTLLLVLLLAMAISCMLAKNIHHDS